MPMLDRVSRWFRGDTAKGFIDLRSTAGSAVIPYQVGRPQWPANDVRTYDRDGYRKVALIFRCVQYIANAAGSAPLRVYFSPEPGQEEEQHDHPMRELIQRPNPQMGESRFTAFVGMLMATTGVAIIEKERDRAGNVIGLWPLRTDWARPIPRQGSAPDWEYRVPGYQDPFMLDAADVIVIPYADTPTFDHKGIGPMEAALREIGIANALTDFLKAFFDRGAMPLYIAIPSDDPLLSSQWSDPAKREAFKESFRQTYGGLNHALDVAIPFGIKDIKAMGLNFDELAYPQLRNMSDAAICEAFGVPPILVGAQVGLEQATYSNAAQARRGFYEDTMTYLWARIDDAFTRHLLAEFEIDRAYSIQFDVSELPALKDDENLKWQRATSAFTAGLISRHIGQREIGVDPHGPDEILQPFSAVPIAITERSTSRPISARLIEPAQLSAGTRFVVREDRVYRNEAAMTRYEREQRATLLSANRKDQAHLANVVHPRLRRYLNEQQDRLIAEVVERSVDDGIEVRAIDDINWTDEARMLEDLMRSWWQQVGETAFSSTGELLGVDINFNLANPYIQQLYETLGLRIKDITETTRKDIEKVILDQISSPDGTSSQKIADSIKNLFTETYQGRAMTIARTETQLAYNMSAHAAYVESGVVDMMELHDNPNHNSDAGTDGLTCAQRNHLIVGLTEVQGHVLAEHPNGTMAVTGVLSTALGEV